MSGNPRTSSEDKRSFTSRSRVERIRDARLMWGRGMGAERIAHHVGVSASTIQRWRLNDRKRGVDWSRERECEQLRDPRELVDALHQRMIEAAENPDLDGRRLSAILTMLDRAAKSAEARLEPNKFEAAAQLFKTLLMRVPPQDRGRLEATFDGYGMSLWRELQRKALPFPPQGGWSKKCEKLAAEIKAMVRRNSGSKGGRGK